MDTHPRASNREIARSLGIAQATVRKRIDTMFADNTLSIKAEINIENFSQLFLAVIGLKIHGDYEKTMKQVMQLPNILFCGLATGTYDMFIIICINSREKLFETVTKGIDKMDGVYETNTYVIMKHKGTAIPANQLKFILDGD